jgi:fermentation-respiration switch protein FrsA (DUF1100 family)
MTKPQPPKNWKRFMFRVLRRLILCYVIILVALLALEDRLLFAPGSEWHPPPAEVAVTEFQLRTAEGIAIDAWWSAPHGWKPADGAILFCHGNGGNLSYRGSMFKPCHELLHVAVLVMDYPGYGRSGGSVGESGCYAAADAAYDWLTGVKHVEPKRLIVMGGSLGGAVAIDLAARRPSRALFLVASFTSFPDMAQTRFPFLPGRWLVHNQFDSLRKIPACRVPVFIAHDRNDGLIPFHQGERLFAAAAEPKQFYPMTGVPHNDQPSLKVYLAFQDFLARCESGKPGEPVSRN